MSYYPYQQQGGYPPPQGQSAAPPPPGGYGHPPNQYQSHSPYPPQQGSWNQPLMQNQQYPQQSYPQQYPPPGQNYGQPPQNQWGQQQYGAPPPGQYPPQQGYPPQQPPYGSPAPGQYGAPPPAQPPYGVPPGQYPPQQSYPPPPQQYGAPPSSQYGAPGQYGASGGPPTPPSLGYGPQQTANIDVTPQVEGLYKAMKGFGTNEKVLIQILSKQDPIQINTIREQYQRRYHTDLIQHLAKETSGNFEDVIIALARGPLITDCWDLKTATKGLGTNEAVLNDVLVGRSNADINAIKTEYQKLHRTTLEQDLRSDLSAATEQLFIMIVAARRNEDSAPAIPQEIENDVTTLQTAFGNFLTKDSIQACQILTSRNDAQLRAIADTYHRRFQEPLMDVLKKSFTGHMEKALMLLLARAQNRALSDAVQLEDSMAGIGTKNTLLIQRVVRAHWNRQHMQQVVAEYQKKYKTTLVKRIKGETSGDYERALIACVE